MLTYGITCMSLAHAKSTVDAKEEVIRMLQQQLNKHEAKMEADQHKGEVSFERFDLCQLSCYAVTMYSAIMWQTYRA